MQRTINEKKTTCSEETAREVSPEGGREVYGGKDCETDRF